MDATPIRVGQVFSGYAAQAQYAAIRASRALKRLRGKHADRRHGRRHGHQHAPEVRRKGVRRALARTWAATFTEATNHPEAQAAKDSFVEAHGELKTIAVSLSKIANDIRLLGSGPRCGIFELSLPATQPGSSIMPGKVNPVICESVMQVACRVIGNDAVVTTAGLGGIGSLFELNVAMPVMIDAFLESVKLLANVSNVFVDKLLTGLEVNEERCRELIDQSLMMVTSLAPKIGYEQAAAFAKEAFESGKTIRELCRERKVLPDAELDRCARSLEDDRAARVEIVAAGRGHTTNGVDTMARKLSRRAGFVMLLALAAVVLVLPRAIAENEATATTPANVIENPFAAKPPAAKSGGRGTKVFVAQIDAVSESVRQHAAIATDRPLAEAGAGFALATPGGP